MITVILLSLWGIACCWAGYRWGYAKAREQMAPPEPDVRIAVVPRATDLSIRTANAEQR